MTAMVSLFFLLALARATAGDPALEAKIKDVFDGYRTACHAEGGDIHDPSEFSLEAKNSGKAAQ